MDRLWARSADGESEVPFTGRKLCVPRCVHKYTEQEEEPAQGSRAKSEHNGDFDFEKG